MSPIAQSKSQELMEKLHNFIVSGKRDDFLKHKLICQFEKLIDIDPVSAHSGLAMIAASIDKNENQMRKHSIKALKYDEKNPMLLYNYAGNLYSFSHHEEAKELLKKALEHIGKTPSILIGIAELAYSINAEDIYFDIVQKAEKHNIFSTSLSILASEIMLANCDSEDEEIEVLNQMFDNNLQNETLRPLTKEYWKDMENFVNELR